MRRYEPMRQRSGTVIPLAVRQAVNIRDGLSCVGAKVGMPGACGGTYELDHVRASHAMGKKSETTVDNLVRICARHHRLRTEEGRVWRPKLLVYLASGE